MPFYVITPAGEAGPYKTRSEARAASLGFPVIQQPASDAPPTCPRCGRIMGDDTPCEPRALDYERDYTIGEEADQ